MVDQIFDVLRINFAVKFTYAFDVLIKVVEGDAAIGGELLGVEIELTLIHFSVGPHVV